MKQKIWCLIHKPKNRIIKIHTEFGYIVGFETKKALQNAIRVDGQLHIEYDEEIRKIIFKY